MKTSTLTRTRGIVTKTRGRGHGPITRIVSPGDIGELIKPFVFLDHFDFVSTGAPMFPMHPHSGIATITVLLKGQLHYEDSTGASGTLAAGGVEWMRAGNGVWHTGHPLGTEKFTGYQVWVALPAELENGTAQSRYLAPETVPRIGAARVVLGSYDGAVSSVPAPAGMNLLHVHLQDGQHWDYQPPIGHTVAWTHVHQGSLAVSDDLLSNELAVFSESGEALEFVAHGETDFIVASAVRHPHDLVLGYYSVHTSHQALEQGEAEIKRIGQQLRNEGRIK
jgi:redox-sensitive bicupin YhaK (pirin superfamily)